MTNERHLPESESGKRVFLTGATGFIGGHLLRVLSERGHHLTCLVRGSSAPGLQAMQLPGTSIVVGEFTRPETWLENVAGHEIVINAVGVIRQTADSSFEDVHAKAPIAYFEAAAAAGAKKAIQISALGADEGAESSYHLSKRRADEALEQLALPAVILRPSFVYGPGDQSMTFFLSLAALPLTAVAGDGEYRVQPVAVEDLARAVTMAVERDEISGLKADVGGSEAVSFNQLLDVLSQRLGKRSAWKIHFPWWWMRFVARLTDLLGRGPISSEELQMLRRGNETDNRRFVEAFGFRPVSLTTGLARLRFSQADRWRARLTHVRLPLRLSVAFIWIATGLISMLLSAEQGYELLRQIGITGLPASLALYGTSLLEVLIGVATAAGWRVRLMGSLQIALMLGFTAILTFGMGELWLHPFGPLTKNVPILGATLAMMALDEN